MPKKLLAEAPVILMGYDLLEQDGEDIRTLPFAERRARLDALGTDLPPEAPFRLSPLVPVESLDQLAEERARSRELMAEG